MVDDDAAIELTDVVLVRTTTTRLVRCRNGARKAVQVTEFSQRSGIAFGSYYVWHPDIAIHGYEPSENWTVGLGNSGYAAQHGLTFWDAVRLARALDDALPEFDVEDPPDDIRWIFESVMGAALADHYVFPIERWTA